jgi:hypothetical protein
MNIPWRKKPKMLPSPEQSEATSGALPGNMQAYAEMVERINKAGGFPLTAFSIAVFVVIAAIVSVAMDKLMDLVPYLFGFAAALTTMAVAVYVLQLRSKERFLESSMELHRQLIMATFNRYLDCKDGFSDNDLQATFALIDSSLGNQVAQARKATADGLPETSGAAKVQG